MNIVVVVVVVVVVVTLRNIPLPLPSTVPYLSVYLYHKRFTPRTLFVTCLAGKFFYEKLRKCLGLLHYWECLL